MKTGEPGESLSLLTKIVLLMRKFNNLYLFTFTLRSETVHYKLAATKGAKIKGEIWYHQWMIG